MLDNLSALISQSTFWLILAIPLTGAVGFALGMISERWYSAHALQRLSKRFDKLIAHVSKVLAEAERACDTLATNPKLTCLTHSERTYLGTLGNKIGRSLSRIQITDASDLQGAKETTSQRKSKFQSFQYPVWVTEPSDGRTQLPDLTAYHQNLKALRSAMANTECTSALLFIKFDQFSRLQRVHGHNEMQKHFQTMIGFCQNHQPESACLHQVTDDLIVLMIPETTAESISEMTQSIRQGIRDHAFMSLDHEKILITASFGWTLFDGNVSENEIWDRAALAVSTSQKSGRNQVHLHDGQSIQRDKAG